MDFGKDILGFLKKNAEKAALDANVVKIYSIYDSRSKCFGNVFVNLNDDVVIRDLVQIITKDKTHLYYTNPDHFTLFCLGSYNIFEGLIKPDIQLIKHFTELKGEENARV